MTTFLSTYLLNDSRLATTTLGAQAESALLSTFPFFLAQGASAQDALADRVLEHVGSSLSKTSSSVLCLISVCNSHRLRISAWLAHPFTAYSSSFCKACRMDVPECNQHRGNHRKASSFRCSHIGRRVNAAQRRAPKSWRGESGPGHRIATVMTLAGISNI